MSSQDEESPRWYRPAFVAGGMLAQDVTQSFKQATQELSLGDLVKDPGFTLFDSISALEIMDPKMDSGCLRDGESLEITYDFQGDMTAEDLLGILDQLLLHEVAWHMGHPLSQTIFTSLHIDRILDPAMTAPEHAFFGRPSVASDPAAISHRVLWAYCLGLIKTCAYVNNRVYAEHYYEEEDFVSTTYNRSLLETFDVHDILALVAATSEEVMSTTLYSEELRQALLNTLSFRRSCLLAVDGAEQRSSNHIYWKEMLTYIPQIQSSSQLGKPVCSAFSTKLQRKLASTVPPRPMVHINADVAYAFLTRLCQDAIYATDVLEYYTPHSLMTRKPQPSIYIRCLLQHYIFHDMVILGDKSMRQLLDDDLALLLLPTSTLLARSNDEVEVPSDPRHQIATRMEAFRERIASPYFRILRTSCQNRCRMRRMLATSISEWDCLQIDAEDLDQELIAYTNEPQLHDSSISDFPMYSLPLSSWAYMHKLKQMEVFIQLGFELGIYQASELSGMYWYLQYVAQSRLRHLERIKVFVVRDYTALAKTGSVTLDQKSATSQALSYLNLQFLEVSATYAYAEALTSLFTVLERLGLIAAGGVKPYSNDRLRYDVRMKPFKAIGLPECLPYEQFRDEVTQPGTSSADLLTYTSASLATAKRTLELLSKLDATAAFCQTSHAAWLANVKNQLRACIFTGIGVVAVRKGLANVEAGRAHGLRLEVLDGDKSYHDWWVVPKVSVVT